MNVSVLHSIYHFQMLLSSHIEWDVEINERNPSLVLLRRLNQVLTKIPLKSGKYKIPCFPWNPLLRMRTQQSQQGDVIGEETLEDCC